MIIQKKQNSTLLWPKLLDYLSDARLKITGQLGSSDDCGSVSELHGLLPSSGQYEKRVYLPYGR